MADKEGVNKEKEMIEEMLSSFPKKEEEEMEERGDSTSSEKSEGTAEGQEEQETSGEEPKKEEEHSGEGSEEAGAEEGGEGEGSEKGGEEEEEDEVTRLRKTVEELSSQKPQLGEESQEEVKGEEEEKGEGEEGKGQPSKEAVEDRFSVDLTDDEYDEIMSSKEKFAKFLMKFGGQVRQQAREDAMKDIPSVVQKTTSRQQALLEKRRQFYENNPDLKEHRNYVGYAANQIYSQNPDLSADELFAKTAERVRKDLALNKQAVEQEDKRLETQSKKKKQPAFTQGTKASRSSPGDTRDELQKELDAMINTGR